MKLKSKWKPPVGETAVAPSGSKDPLMLDLNDVEDGCGHIIRLISWHERDRIALDAIQPVIRPRRKDGEATKPIRPWIVVPDDVDLGKITDDDSQLLSEVKTGTVYYLPVWVRGKFNKKGNISEEINDVRYIRFGAQIKKGIEKLQTDEKRNLAFDDLPNYDIRITKTGESNNWYVVEPVRDDEGDCGEYWRKDLQKALSAEDWEIFEENIDVVIDRIESVVAKELSMSESDLKNKFSHYRKPKDSDGNDVEDEEPSKPLRERPKSARTSSRDYEDEETEEPEEVEEEVVERPKRPKATATKSKKEIEAYLDDEED